MLVRFNCRRISLGKVLVACWITALAAAILWPLGTASASIEPYRSEAQRRVDMEDRFNRCGLIVLATIAEKHSYRMEDGNIFTKVCLDVEFYLRNSHPDSEGPCFWVRGGDIGTEGQMWSETPEFQIGQPWVLALPWSESEQRQGWQYGRHTVALRVVEGQVVDRYGLISEFDGRAVEVNRVLHVGEYLQEVKEFLLARDPDVLREKCDHIVLGTVSEVVEHRDVPRGAGEYADVSLEIENVLKGDLGKSRIAFRVFLIQYVFRETPPSFVEGERCVVFFSEDPDGDLSIVSGMEGKYVVEDGVARNEFRSYPLDEFERLVSRWKSGTDTN